MAGNLALAESSLEIGFLLKQTADHAAGKKAIYLAYCWRALRKYNSVCYDQSSQSSQRILKKGNPVTSTRCTTSCFKCSWR